jgi:hypothetical protein
MNPADIISESCQREDNCSQFTFCSAIAFTPFRIGERPCCEGNVERTFGASWYRTAPRPWSEASVPTFKGKMKSGKERIVFECNVARSWS